MIKRGMPKPHKEFEREDRPRMRKRQVPDFEEEGFDRPEFPPHKFGGHRKGCIPHPPFPPREDLEGMLMHAGHLLHKGHHFGRSQDEVLDFLNKQENVSQKDLGGYLRIKPGTLSELLNKLEEKELISREKDEEDRRFSNIVLTEKGREFLEIKEEKKPKDKFKVLNKEEKENIKNLLSKLISSLED